MAANSHVVGGYIYSLAAIPGVVAANNYLSLFNPSGNTKRFIVAGLFLSNTQTNPSAVVTPMRGWRTSAASGGTLVTDLTTIAKVQTPDPTPTAEIRTGNPTVTLGAALFNSPPQLEARTSNVHDVDLPVGFKPFTLLPGEGIALRAETQTTSTFWNMTIVWAEAGR